MEHIIEEALKSRPIFHSEADFQHHLAWHIHKKGMEVRLEYPFASLSSEKCKDSEKREYCDIVIMKNGSPEVCIELKYKTQELPLVAKREKPVVINGEPFSLTKHGGHPQGRYDFCADVARLESWRKHNKVAYGYAVFLTNDSAYWNPPRKKEGVDKDFKIHEKLQKEEMQWKEGTSKGTKKGRESPIQLSKEYPITWCDHSSKGKGEFDMAVAGKHNCTFKYTCVKVG